MKNSEQKDFRRDRQQYNEIDHKKSFGPCSFINSWLSWFIPSQNSNNKIHFQSEDKIALDTKGTKNFLRLLISNSYQNTLGLSVR